MIKFHVAGTSLCRLGAGLGGDWRGRGEEIRDASSTGET